MVNKSFNYVSFENLWNICLTFFYKTLVFKHSLRNQNIDVVFRRKFEMCRFDCTSPLILPRTFIKFWTCLGLQVAGVAARRLQISGKFRANQEN